MGKRLDHKLDCKSCGTIYLEIPDDASDSTPISCSTCGAHLGTWGALQHDFYLQTRGTTGVFEMNDGQFDERTPVTGKPETNS
jgi:hypothetical protein